MIRNFLLALGALLAFAVVAQAQIQAGKSIQISIANVPPADKAAIDAIYPVSGNGTINMPHIGLVQAAGYAPQQLALALQQRYKSAGIYTNPTIQVIDNTVGTRPEEEIVTVGGYVNRPGPVPYRKELTLWQAVQSAGGATAFGSMKRVTLFRNGKRQVYNLEVPANMRIPLQRNDTIEVPQKTVIGG